MLKRLPTCYRLKGSINTTAPISHSKSAKYPSENTWQRWKQVYQNALWLHLCYTLWRKELASSPWPAAGSLSPVCHIPTWLSWNCHPRPQNPLPGWLCLSRRGLRVVDVKQWRCSLQLSRSGVGTDSCGDLGEALHASVSCPSSHLLTLLPTCGLSSTPPLQGAWLQTSEVSAKPEQGFFSTRLPKSPQPLGTPSPSTTPGFSDGLSGDVPISPIFSLKYRSLLMRTHPLAQSFMCWRPEHSQSPAPWTPAPS